jgi:hypothetical protein
LSCSPRLFFRLFHHPLPVSQNAVFVIYSHICWPSLLIYPVSFRLSLLHYRHVQLIFSLS